MSEQRGEQAMTEIDESYWYDEFWEALPDELVDNEDATTSAVRLWGEAFRGGLVWRDGDDLIGRSDGGSANRMRLTVDDQHLIRVIEEASQRATDRAGGDEKEHTT
jgi:hypothetical protein